MRLRVAHIIGLAQGGGGRTVGLNAIAPCAEHFDTYAILGREGDLPELLRQRGVKVETVGLDHATKSLLSIPAIARRLRRIKPDVVVNYGQPAGLVGDLACRLAGIKKVLYVTCFPSFYTDWDMFRVIRNHLVERISCRGAAMVGCPSHAALYQYALRQLLKTGQAVYFPLGVRLESAEYSANKSELRAELGLPAEKPLVVSVCRLSDQKRVDWLVNAWAKVEKNNQQAELILVGEGEEKVALQNLAARLGLKRCRFLGYHPAGARFFSACDISVVTTMYEIPGLTVLEAMAARCPVVVTAADGVTENVLASQGGGLLVPSGDTNALADGLLELLASEEKRLAMGARGRAYVEREHALPQAQAFQRELISRVAQTTGAGD